MAERHAKRPKINRGEDDYLPANITEIELHNFMTFENVMCKPGSRLNLVIGPNGSGKSSIVCAIALGLGGDTQIRGRAGSIGAYVKRGEESGYIKITLRGDSREERIGITRKIDTSNKSEWLLNGKITTKKDVIEVVQKFNIQVNNLTQVIFDFRFLALLAIGGSLAGSVLCFMNGCIFVFEAYKVYYSSCLKGVHTGQMVLKLVEAIDVYLAGTVMLVFAMGLYGLFISNIPDDVHPSVDRAITGSSLFGMFALKERPKWMKINSLGELKTKVGHVIVMILIVKMFERSKNAKR